MAAPRCAVVAPPDFIIAASVDPGVMVAVPATMPPWAGGVGGGGGSTYVYTQVSPSASWSIPHVLGRLPNVQVYISGQAVIADITSTSSLVTVVFPSAVSGVAVLA